MADPADQGTAPAKTEEELRREAEERIRKANNQRNADRLARMEEIADSAEKGPEHKDDEELTDEMWADQELTDDQRAARAIVRARAEESEGDEEDEEREPEIEDADARNDQGEEERDDEAREAGADDVRIVNGVKEYRLVINGREVWRTLKQIRASASKVEAADEYLSTAVETAKRATREAPTAEEVEEAKRKKQERRTRVKELLKRQALGDEQAIDELAELIDATPSAVTPDVLRALDERFDSRVTFREAVTWFEDEFQNELKHPAMKSYAGELDAALAAANPRMSPKERLRRVGSQIRKELQDTYGLTRGQRPGPSDKARRKAEVRRPNAAGDRQPPKADEDEVEDTSSVIQKIAQSRHQPRAVVHGPNRNR